MWLSGQRHFPQTEAASAKALRWRLPVPGAAKKLRDCTGEPWRQNVVFYTGL